MLNKIFFAIRLFLGIVFLVSGFEKAMSPSENFLYVIRAYDVIPDDLGYAVSVVFPWVEFLTGAFVLSGLWLDKALRLVILISMTFIVIVGQAIIRKLPLESCGCFGEFIHLPLKGVIILDTMIVVLSLLSLRNMARARYLSLDALYEKKQLLKGA